MNTKSTIAWRSIVIGLLAVTAPLSIHWYEKWRQVDTETMLNVSVSIKTISYVQVDSVGDSVWSTAGGSGILISNQDCEVLTNHHVVENAAHIEVFPRQWPNTSGIPAKVVNSNPRTDVAILRISRCDGLPQALLGDSDFVSPGDEVYAVGNPLGKNPDSISRGILSHTERFQNDGLPYLQTDANINHGNSGGALFNRNAEVIGVNTGILATSSGQKFGIAYALPINLVKSEAGKLRTGSPSWGDAGIDDLVAELTPD
ncbi:MAG: trypsin-like peptidase domain-containing protein, partial [Arenicellales bacterium]